MSETKQVYKIKAKIERNGVPAFWMRIGTATRMKDGKIICTMDALPLHSDGVFMLYPNDDEKEDGK